MGVSVCVCGSVCLLCEGPYTSTFGVPDILMHAQIPIGLRVDSPFFPTIVLFEHRPFPGFLEVFWKEFGSLETLELCPQVLHKGTRFSVVYFSRGTLPPKKNGKRALLGDLVPVVTHTLAF